MSQFYLDPSRESDPNALPNAEVFYMDAANWEHGSPGPGSAFPQASSPGWYWWPCFPGCLPDGDPNGPFDTEALAIADAQEDID